MKQTSVWQVSYKTYFNWFLGNTCNFYWIIPHRETPPASNFTQKRESNVSPVTLYSSEFCRLCSLATLKQIHASQLLDGSRAWFMPSCPHARALFGRQEATVQASGREAGCHCDLGTVTVGSSTSKDMEGSVGGNGRCWKSYLCRRH
jgi:hypothetical protein